MRFLLYSHDGMGLGHVRRQLAIASAITNLQPAAQVLLATSIDEVFSLGLPANVDTLKLPGLRKLANEDYASRRLALTALEIRALRSALLRTAVHSYRPDVVLVDKHPLGACGELRSALEMARLSGARAVLGLRDILDAPASVLKEWEADGIRSVISEYYDLVLVYGEQSVFDPVKEYQLMPRVAARTRFCGYVVNRTAAADGLFPPEDSELCPGAGSSGSPQPLVLGTTGGGEDGFVILKTFIEAAAGAPWKALAVAGPLLAPNEFQTLQMMAARNGVLLHRFVPCLSNLFRQLDALVCMGGYNTLAEAISTGVPTVCIPRVTPRSEQLLRARSFERLGLIRVIHPEDLSAEHLRQQVAIAVAGPRRPAYGHTAPPLKFNGTQRAARYLLELKPIRLKRQQVSWSLGMHAGITR